jgi:hypothetical protein
MRIGWVRVSKGQAALHRAQRFHTIELPRPSEQPSFYRSAIRIVGTT